MRSTIPLLAGTRAGGDPRRILAVVELSGRGAPMSPTTSCGAARVGLDFDDDDWAEVAVPGHWRTTPPFADNDGPLLYRTRFELDPAPEGSAPLASTLDGIFYQADVWLDGAYLGDPEGYFFPHTLRGHRAVAPRRRARAGRRGGLPAAAQPHAKRNITGVFQHWDCIDPTGTRAASGGRCASRRPGRCASTAAGAVPRRQRHARPPAPARPARQRRGRAPCACARRSTASLLDQHEQSLAGGAQRGRVDARRRRPAAVVAVDARRPAAERRRRSRSSSTTRSSDTPHACAPGCARWRCSDWVVHGQRRAAVPQGRQPGADAHGARRRHARRARAATSSWPARPGSTCSACTPTSPGPSCTTPPTSWACCCGRTSRCSGATPARSASRPCARPARPSTCSATTRRSPCGARTTSRSPSNLDRAAPIGKAAVQVRRRPAAAVVEQDGARPLGEAGPRAGRRDPHRRSPTAACCPHLPQLDGTDSHLYFGWYHGDERDLAGFAASMPRMVRFVSEFGAQAVPDDRRLHGAGAVARPRLGASSSERHGLQLHAFDEHVPPADYATFDAWRDGDAALPGDLLRHHIETLRRLKYRPTGGFCFFMLTDAVPDGVVERARPRTPAEAGLPGGRRRLPPGDRRRRPAARDRVAPAPRWPSTSTSSATCAACSTARSAPPSCSWPGGIHAWRWGGDVPPTCVRVGTIQFVVPDAARRAVARPRRRARRRGHRHQPLRRRSSCLTECCLPSECLAGAPRAGTPSRHRLVPRPLRPHERGCSGEAARSRTWPPAQPSQPSERRFGAS